ncbi:MAG: hypothetical protein AAF726_08015 [Planctomycetota bacterium]
MRSKVSPADRPQANHTLHAARSIGSAAAAAATGVVAATALLAGCGSSESSDFAGDLFIEACSLACTDGTGGLQVNCGVVNVTENVEVSVLFSNPIDASTLNSSTFQVTDVGNGSTVEGLRLVDPLDPRRAIFRPAINFQTGGVSFAFGRNRSYEVRIPGAAQGDSGPFLRSIEGDANQSRLLCTIFTSEGITDIVPGNPFVEVTVRAVETDMDGNTLLNPDGSPVFVPGRVQLDEIGEFQRVWRESDVQFAFNELMNIPTVANVLTGQSLTMFVEIDSDGDLATSDRDPLPGVYEVDVDQVGLTTTALFTPSGDIPSAGENGRRLVVRVTPQVLDLVNLPVTSDTGGGVLSALPEKVAFGSIEIAETFDDGSLEDANGTGAAWGNGVLAPTLSGGSGRLGELRIPQGADDVILNTDSQIFPLGGLFTQRDLIGNDTGSGYPEQIVVTDGVFEFSTLELGPNTRLILQGSNPGRILVRGRCSIAGGAIIDVSGTTAPAHDSTVPMPSATGVAPAGGPNAADGGFGADRADLFDTELLTIGGIVNTGANRRGRDGTGVGGPSGLAGTRGRGGNFYPNNLPEVLAMDLMTVADIGFNIRPDPLDPASADICLVQMIGATGGGGAYSANGSPGTVEPVGPPLTENPANRSTTPSGSTPGGSSNPLGLAPPSVDNVGYDTRLLRWDEGDLRGGSSGGGGGNHPYGSRGDGNSAMMPIADNCVRNIDPLANPRLDRWVDHSGASGGSGGGAVELLAGRSVDLMGTIDARGGGGGSATANIGEGSFAMPGGGGSGGAIRLRSPDVQLGAQSRLDVRGGSGGTAPWSQFEMQLRARGGDGAAGLVRVEDETGAISLATVRDNVLPPSSSDLQAASWLSVDGGFLALDSISTQRPDSIVGATSCWIRPDGNFFQLTFTTIPEENPPTVANAWDMDVVLDNGTTRPFRSNQPNSWEGEFGNLLGYDLPTGGGSPIVVRFQGARTREAGIPDGVGDPGPCNVDLNDPMGAILAGSVTPWVEHPSQLLEVLDSNGANFRPDAIRFCVLFDRTINGANDSPGADLTNVVGVDNLVIRAIPD